MVRVQRTFTGAGFAVGGSSEAVAADLLMASL
jgi:hypothetical protein